MISRQEALAQGLPRYFNGKPCKHGHVSERFVSNRGCYQCFFDRMKKNAKKRNADLRQQTKSRLKKEREALEKKCGRKVILRKEAKELGLTRYFNGKPCPQGHIDERRTVCGGCVICINTRQATSEVKARKLAWARANKNKINAKRRDWYDRNKDNPEVKARLAETKKRYRAKPETRKKETEYALLWMKKNPEKAKEHARRSAKKRRQDPKHKAYYAERTRYRQAKRKNATLPNIKPSEFFAFYEERDRLFKQTGEAHHVDHIVPLEHARVCGLHVPWNLQVIPAWENHLKLNKLPEEFYGEGGREEWLKRRHQ
jgi:hypothetical protein